MENQEKNYSEYYTIDIMHILKALWSRIWIILVCGFLCAAIGFSIASFVIKPSYSSNIKLYINNSSISIGSNTFSISSSELTAAQGLLKTYGEILNSRSTLERVIKKANIDYSWKELLDYISYSSVNGTEIMEVTVTCNNPKEACKIANTIADVLPVRIEEIIDGASMEIVDKAVENPKKVSPNVGQYSLKGFFIGLFLSALIIALFAVLDGTIHDEDYIIHNYDYPILGKVPNLSNKPQGYSRVVPLEHKGCQAR